MAACPLVAKMLPRCSPGQPPITLADRFCVWLKSGMRYNQIVRAREGTSRHIQHVDEVKIPDLWHTAMAIKEQAEGRPDRPLNAEDATMVMETWILCHDLLQHIKRVCVEPNTE